MHFSRQNFNIKNTQFFIIILIIIICIVVSIFFTWPVSSSSSVQSNLSSTTFFSKLKYLIPANHFNQMKIGFVKPTFTDAAYNNKFYVFYVKYTHISSKANVTKDLGLLNSKLSNRQSGTIHNVFALVHLIRDVKAVSNRTQVNILTDTDVNNGKIFGKHQSNLYNVLVLGHQEYVTQKEYDNLKQFVSNGGTMILLDGNVFYAEVKYFGNNNTISLVKGHGWAYNGKTAWKSIAERWKSETQTWVGSNYLCYICIKTFRDNPFGYLPHEEQYITNPKDVILFNYNPVELPSAPKSNVAISMYGLNYGKGKVIAFGIYSDDIIQNENFNLVFTKIIEKLFVKL